MAQSNRRVPESKAPALLLTCEHATNHVPAHYRALFKPHAEILNTHRGFDLGALALARAMQQALRCPLLITNVSRLLIENNRSLHHPSLFSEFSRSLSEAARDEVIRQYYATHRDAVCRAIQQNGSTNHVTIHIGVHSFTPNLNGVVRRVDIGILYDPKRPSERAFSHHCQGLLRAQLPELVIRRNGPYRGTSDGLTTALRTLFSPSKYLGIELEVNNKHLSGRSTALRRRIIDSINNSLQELLRGRMPE